MTAKSEQAAQKTEDAISFAALNRVVDVLAVAVRAGIFRVAGTDTPNRIRMTGVFVDRLCDTIGMGLCNADELSLASTMAGVADEIRRRVDGSAGDRGEASHAEDLIRQNEISGSVRAAPARRKGR